MTSEAYNLKFLHKDSKVVFFGRTLLDGSYELKNPLTQDIFFISCQDLERDYSADIGNILLPKFKRHEQDQIGMFSHLPIDNPDALKEEESANCLNENLALAMNRRGIQLVDLVKGTGMAWGTIMGWVYGKGKGVRVQLADENLLNLITYLECTSDWLCFGIGEDDRPLVKFKEVKIKKGLS